MASFLFRKKTTTTKYAVKGRCIQSFIGIAMALLVLGYGHVYILMFSSDHSSAMVEERLLGEFLRLVPHHKSNFTRANNQEPLLHTQELKLRQQEKLSETLSNLQSQGTPNKRPGTALQNPTSWNAPPDDDEAATVIDLSKYYYYPPTPRQQELSNQHHPHLLLPTWFQSYQTWHALQRQGLNESTWTNYKYLVARCLKNDVCGGAADRLLPVVTLLRIAAQTNRLFLIYWERPGLLQEYLVPPMGGLDWTTPDYLVSQLLYSTTNIGYTNRLDRILSKSFDPKLQFVRAKYQSYNYGSEYYNQQRQHEQQQKQSVGNDHHHEDAEFQIVFAPIWNQLFTPSPRVAHRIYHQWKALELVPGHYVGTHIRALYATAERDTTTLEFWTRNALDCASHFRGGIMGGSGSIYFASDAAQTHTMAVDYGRLRQVRVVVSSSLSSSSSSSLSPQQPTLVPSPRPLHLDKDVNYENRTVADFDDTFVDLYLLAHGKCIVRGRGGYGTWVSLLMRMTQTRIANEEEFCDFQHQSLVQQIGCEWDDTTPQDLHQHQRPTQLIAPMFVAPMMMGINVVTTATITTTSTSMTSSIGDTLQKNNANTGDALACPNRNTAYPPKLQTVLDQIYVKTGKPYGGDLWNVSEWIPPWMKRE
jgi:hypothetical protein